MINLHKAEAELEKPFAERGHTEFSFWWLALSTVTSASSIISFVQRTLRIGLAPIFFEMLEFYRRVTYPIIELITVWSPISVPDWYKDLLILSFVCLTALLRAVVAARARRYSAEIIDSLYDDPAEDIFDDGYALTPSGGGYRNTMAVS